MANVRFVRTTKERQIARISQQTCDDNALYFCTDSGEIYRGAYLMTDGARVVPSYENLPSFSSAADGIIYYALDTKNSYLLNSTRDGWEQMTPNMAQYATIEVVETRINTVTEQVESVQVQIEEKIKTEIEDQISQIEVVGNLDGGEI